MIRARVEGSPLSAILFSDNNTESLLRNGSRQERRNAGAFAFIPKPQALHEPHPHS